MKKNLLQFLFVLLLLGSKAYAQSKTITGTVIGKDDGAPIPGVTVTLVGSKTGTVTNINGVYTIKVPDAGQHSLKFSSIGYVAKTIAVSGGKIDVVLEANSSSLNEVLVVGYGTQVKRDNIGSVTSIGSKDITEKPVQNFVQALAGQAAGVQVTSANGVLNTPPVFRIRGTNSISLSSQPLIVVDGVPSFTGDGVSDNNPLSNINPEDIESIDIAKDAAGTAIYGSRAANGVVFVTTKKGKKGHTSVSIDSYYGVSKVQRLPQLLNASQYVMIKNEGLVNAGLYNPSTTYFALGTDAAGNTIDTKWFDYIYRTGKTYNSTVSITGGNDATNYYMSANYVKEGGILMKNDFIRKSMLFNIDHKASKIISMGAKLSYSNGQDLNATSAGSLSGDAFAITGLGRIPLVSPPNVSPYNNDGSYNVNGNTLGFGANKGVSTSYYNIVPILDMNRQNTESNHISANSYIQLKPLSWITLRTNYGIDYIFNDTDQFLNAFQGDGSPNGSATDTYSKNKNWVWDNTLQFDHTFAKHTFSLLFGNEQQYNKTTGFGLARSVLSDPAFNIIQAGFTTNATAGLTYGENYLVSFFGRFNYDFDKKYLLTATLRQDQYSGFGFNKKKGIFPGFGLGWEVTKEKFWTSIGADKVFSSFKLRGSYGRVGNNAGLGNYASYGFYGNGVFNTQSTLVATQTGNDDLGWETSTKTDFGFNFGILGDRINGDVAFYKNDNSNLILSVSTAPSAGLPTRPTVNIGSMYNKGVEFTINAEAVRSRDFGYTTSFNIGYNQNKILSLSPGVTSLTASTAGNEVTNINQVGYPISNLYIIRTGGVDPATGRRIFINGAGRKVLYNPVGGAAAWTYMDDGTTAPPISQSADAVNLTNSAPKVVGGFNNTFRYKGFDLNVLVTYQLGFSLYYGTNAGLHDQRFWNNTTDVLNRWTTPGQITNIPKIYYNDNVSNGSTLPIDANVFNGNFVKLKTVNFGYSLPKTFVQKFGISNLRFYVSGYNLAMITKYPGPDPEVSSNGASNTSQGVDRNTSANQRTITAGFSVKF